MTFLAPLITRFLRDHMPRQRGYSPHSCETYAHGFRLLFTYAAGRLRTKPSQLHIEQLDAALIMDFLGHIERERGNGATTRNLRLAAIKTFMRYVEYQVPSALEQIGQIHAIPTKRHDQKLIRHLVMEEVRAILNAPDLTRRLGIRDRAMMHLCFAAGLRVSELVEAMAANLSLQRTPSLLVKGKGRKERCLPLWKETAADLRAWLTVRGNVRVPELFVNAEGAPMSSKPPVPHQLLCGAMAIEYLTMEPLSLSAKRRIAPCLWSQHPRGNSDHCPPSTVDSDVEPEIRALHLTCPPLSSAR